MVGESLVPVTDEAEWAAVSPRQIGPEDWQRFEGYISEIFGALGLAIGSEATADTPRRFLRALFDATSGYEGDEKLVTAFETECHGGSDCRISQIVEGPIPFFALCEHHALPFFGKAYIGYIAHEHILGLSKLTRLVRLFARRFSVQERIGRQLAESLQQILLPQREQGQHLHKLECHVIQVGAGAVPRGVLTSEYGVGTPVQAWADDGKLSGQDGQGCLHEVERAEDHPAEADRDRHARSPTLQRRVQEGDRKHHPEPEKGDGDCYSRRRRIH
ncbi:hypothetical protein GCM10009535_29780 [Streptomyces thermocarboxydovorans]|uniref:GTP cyclohydrolase 1 n=1 Tax=Streptomyces thermocarboxydovorans TaxID=59298 RepID=A0ABP3SLZ1_9ACTN